MSTPNPLVCDLSHWDPATSYAQVKAAGIVGVIFKATQGTSMRDGTYVAQQAAAKLAGLQWGSYHFADRSDAATQAQNYLRFAAPDPTELFALDWEDNNGNKMSLQQVIDWVTIVENALGRPGQCVIYSGNTAKEALGSTHNEFLGSRRLWLAQYTTTPSVQISWSTWWLWQYTDGVNGPPPHSINGVGHCDINSFQGTPEDLATQWATGGHEPVPVPPPEDLVVNITIDAPPGVKVNITGG